MTRPPVYIAGVGILSALGSGLEATEKGLRENRSAITPLSLFTPLYGAPLPTGQVNDSFLDRDQSSLRSRTHRLALTASRQALASSVGKLAPEAVILGTTTGGIYSTEELLRKNSRQIELYQFHGLHTVATDVARQCRCTGPALVVSTACSSGVVAIALAVQMLRCGMVKSVLAGGVDSLSRLPYFGFLSLQLVDQAGCRPLDKDRQGMAVAEGAGMLLLTTEKPQQWCAEIVGTGLSCDAYHPVTPHPEGQGAYNAMHRALADAGLDPGDISYINLHGTGTPENDLAEAKAVRRLFSVPPPLSSIKGATGHSLAAAGAIEAIVSAIAVAKGLLPANTNLRQVDPLLGVSPVRQPVNAPVQTVLTNSFGFCGNNGSLIIAAPKKIAPPAAESRPDALAVHGYSCVSGAGGTGATTCRIYSGNSAAGKASVDTLSKNLAPRLVRRLKRLPRMTLSLAISACSDAQLAKEKQLKPGSVFMGTGWGSLSETYDFLKRLRESTEQFPSPTDFVGSVHNGPAGQVAIMFGATGPNITTSGGNYSFEQALFAAQLSCDEPAGSALILGADEGHEHLSPLLDPSIGEGAALADGGGALYVNRSLEGAVCTIFLPFYQSCRAENVMAALVNALKKHTQLQEYALILIGIPAAQSSICEQQLTEFTALMQTSAPIIGYRQFTGEFTSASALATALAVSFFVKGSVPGPLIGGENITLTKDTGKILIVGLGEYITAIHLSRP